MPGVTELLSANQQEGEDKITPPSPRLGLILHWLPFGYSKKKKSIGWGWGSGLGHFYKVYIGAQRRSIWDFGWEVTF